MVAARWVTNEGEQDADAYQAHLGSSHFAEHGFGDAVPRLAERERPFYEPIGD